MTFVEFWGTWCAPCKELTPKVVNMHNKFGDKVRFISVADDKDINDVKAYVKEYKLNWEQSFVDMSNLKNTIVDAWKIIAYPTFILIDEAHNLYYVGGGNETLDYIDKVLTDKFTKGKLP